MSEYRPTRPASPEDLASHGGMTCFTFDGFIVDYVERRLDATTRAAFEAHIAGCEACKAYLAEYERAMRGAGKAYTDDLADVPADLVEAILKAVK